MKLPRSMEFRFLNQSLTCDDLPKRSTEETPLPLWRPASDKQLSASGLVKPLRAMYGHEDLYQIELRDEETLQYFLRLGDWLIFSVLDEQRQVDWAAINKLFDDYLNELNKDVDEDEELALKDAFEQEHFVNYSTHEQRHTVFLNLQYGLVMSAKAAGMELFSRVMSKLLGDDWAGLSKDVRNARGLDNSIRLELLEKNRSAVDLKELRIDLGYYYQFKRSEGDHKEVITIEGFDPGSDEVQAAIQACIPLREIEIKVSRIDRSEGYSLQPAVELVVTKAFAFKRLTSINSIPDDEAPLQETNQDQLPFGEESASPKADETAYFMEEAAALVVFCDDVLCAILALNYLCHGFDAMQQLNLPNLRLVSSDLK